MCQNLAEILQTFLMMLYVSISFPNAVIRRYYKRCRQNLTFFPCSLLFLKLFILLTLLDGFEFKSLHVNIFRDIFIVKSII